MSSQKGWKGLFHALEIEVGTYMRAVEQGERTLEGGEVEVIVIDLLFSTKSCVESVRN